MDDGSQKLLDVIDDPRALESFLGIAAAGAVSSADSATSRSAAVPVPVSTQHFVLTPISHSPLPLQRNISVSCPSSQPIISPAHSQGYIYTPVKSSSSSSGIAVVASSIAFGHSEAVISSSNISFSNSSNNLCLETSGIQIGNSRMPSGPSSAPVGPPALTQAVSVSSNVSGSSSIATVLSNPSISVGSGGMSNILVGPPGTVFTSANLSLSQMTIPQSTTASPSSPFSIPTRSPHAPPTPSPSPLPRRSPAPQHSPSPAPSPYHMQLQSPQNNATTSFVLSAAAPQANLVKDIITSLPLLHPPSLKSVQGANITSPQAASNYSVGSSMKESFRGVHQQTSAVVLPQRLSATSGNNLQSPQNASSPPSIHSFLNLQTQQPVLISQSTNLQTCQGSQVLTHGAKNNSSIGPGGSNNGTIAPGGALTPAPSPSPQHRTVQSPVIRSTTPTPVIHQTLPAGLAIPATQQFPAVMSQGGTAVLQTTNHQLVQIIHQSAAVQGPGFPAHAQIITAGGGAAGPVHLHTAAAAAAAASAGAAAAAAAKTKQPPQILPKPPGTAVSGHVKMANVAAPSHQGLHSQNHSAGTQVVIGQSNQAAMIPTAQGGALLLNQVLRLVAAQGTVQLQPIQTPSGPTLIAVPSGSALSFQPVSQLASQQHTQTTPQPTSKLPTSQVSIQAPSNIIPAVLNNIQQTFQQNTSRTNIQNNTAITNLNLNVHNLSLNVTNTNSASCSHNDIAGESLPSCQSCSGPPQSHQKSNSISESPLNVNLNVNLNLTESSQKRTSPSGLQKCSSDLPKENIEALNNKEQPANHMVAPSPIPQTKKKPKKKKKKNKLDLANIMKLSGIGDDDDIDMYEAEEQTIQPSSIAQLHSVDQLQPDSGIEATQMLNNVSTSPQIPVQALDGSISSAGGSVVLENLSTDESHTIQSSQQDNLTTAHTHLTSLITNENGSNVSSDNLPENHQHVVVSQVMQQHSPSGSPHLVSTGTNTVMAQPTPVTSLPSSQPNSVNFVAASYASSMSQSVCASPSESYQISMKQTDSCVGGTYVDPLVQNQKTKDTGTEATRNVDITSVSNASNCISSDKMRLKASGTEMKDNFTSASLTDQPKIVDKLVNTLPGRMNVIIADAVAPPAAATTPANSMTPLSSVSSETCSTICSQTVGKTTQVLCTATPGNMSTRKPQNESVSILIGANSSSNFISNSVTPTPRNCVAIDSFKGLNGDAAKQTVAATSDKGVSVHPPGITSTVNHGTSTCRDRIVIGNSAMTQTENMDVSSCSSGNTLLGQQFHIQNSNQTITKLSDRQSMFLPVSSSNSSQNICNAPKSFPAVDNTPTFLGLHAFHSLQGLVSSATPLMASIPPITSNAGTTNSNYGRSLAYTGSEPLVIAHHQGGLQSVITGPQLLQCLQQAQGQQTGVINMSALQLTQNAISKVIGSSTSSLSFNTGSGTILIGSNPVENFTNTSQAKSTTATAAAVLSSAKFIPQQSVLLQQLNTGVRRCSSDSNSSLSLGSPPSVISLISQQAASQTEHTNNQPLRKGPSQESTETQTVSVGVQNSISNNSNSNNNGGLTGLSNTVHENITQTNNNFVVNKFTKSVQYNSVSNMSSTITSTRKKKRRYDRTPPKGAGIVGSNMSFSSTSLSLSPSATAVTTAATTANTSCFRNVSQQIENGNRIYLSVDANRCVVQERSVPKTFGSQSTVLNQNFQKLPIEAVSSCSLTCATPSTQFNVTSNIRAAVVSPLVSAVTQQNTITTSTSIFNRTVPSSCVTSNANQNLFQQTSLIPLNNVTKGNSHFPSCQDIRNPPSTQVPSIVQASLSTNSLMISNQPEILQVSSSSVTLISNGITSTSEIQQRKTGDTLHTVAQVHNSQQANESVPVVNPVKLIAIQEEHQQPQATQNGNMSSCSIINPQQTVNSQLCLNNLNQAVPHLVPIPSNSISVHPGPSHGLQIQAAGNGGTPGVLPGSIIQKVHTIQLTPQNQKNLKAVQMQIQSYITKKTLIPNDQVLQQLFEEQQRILATGKLVPTIPGQHAQGLQFVGTQTCTPPEEFSQNASHLHNKTLCNLSPNGQQCGNSTFMPLNSNKCMQPSSGKFQPSHQPTTLKSVTNSAFTNGNKPHGMSCSSSTKPQIASSSASPPRGIKRSATSPLRSISRSDLIEHQLKTDQAEASQPDVQTPFSSSQDACKRLIRYHVYNEKVLSQKDLEKADEIFEATAKHLLDKFRQMMNKYNYLLLMESMREVNTSELIMIDRMFVAEEHNILEKLKEEELKSKEAPASTNLPVTEMAVKSEPTSETQSNRFVDSDLADIRDVRVVIQDVMKNESIKRELEEDKFTVIKKEKLDFDEDSDENTPIEPAAPSLTSKVDHNYDEWEEIQKELGVFCPTSQPSCALQENTVVVKLEVPEDVESCCRHIKVEEEDDMPCELKHMDNLSCRTLEYSETHDSVQSVSSETLKCEPDIGNIDSVQKSCDSDENSELCDIYNHNIPKSISSDTHISEESNWDKKFPVVSGSFKDRCSITGTSDEGRESLSLKYLNPCVSSDFDIQRNDSSDICDSTDDTMTFVHKRKRHKHDTHFVSECVEELSNVMHENRSFCESEQENEGEEENDALNAQVQSAIDSILNLQRSEDDYDLSSTSVSAMSDGILSSQIDRNSDYLDKYSRKISEDTFFTDRSTKLQRGSKRTMESVVNSCVSSPVPMDYDEADPFISGNSAIVITNGDDMEEDSVNGDTALDEAVRSILTS